MVTKVGHGPLGALCPGALDQSVLFQGVAGRQRAGPGDSTQLPNWMQVTCTLIILLEGIVFSYSHQFQATLECQDLEIGHDVTKMLR